VLGFAIPAANIDLERAGRTGPSHLAAFLRLVRPHQWTKNLFCFAGVLFGPGRLPQSHAWLLDALTFLVFVAASSSVYILNDVLDRDRDRRHRNKRLRPIASGLVSIPAAMATAALLALLAVAGSFALGNSVAICLCLYIGNSFTYSFILKDIAVIDVISIACGFVLRLLAGVYALDDLPTAWIVLCSFFLALFLGIAKRRAELASLLEEEEMAQRPVLLKYTVPFLDYLLNSASVMAIMCYALFTTTAQKNPSLVVTVPIVFWAVMHYKRLIMLLQFGEEPERIVLRDSPLLAGIGLWLGSYLIIYWGNVHLFR
jgi:4-hydroxybenzoate polyprenyltransferase